MGAWVQGGGLEGPGLETHPVIDELFHLWVVVEVASEKQPRLPSNGHESEQTCGMGYCSLPLLLGRKKLDDTTEPL